MKRKIVTTMVALALATSMATSAFGAQLLIDYNGMTQVLEDTSNEDGTIYIEAKELNNLLGLEYKYDTTTGILKLSKNGDELVISTFSGKTTFNGEKVTDPVLPIIKRDYVKLPLRFVAETFGDTVNYDEETRRITFDNSEFYLSNIKNVGKETSTTTKVYTYDEAVKRTKMNNTNVKQMYSTIDNLESNLDQTKYSISIYGMQVGNDFVGQVSASQFNSLLSSANTLEKNIKNMEYTIEILDTASELSLMSSLLSVKLTELSMVLLDETLAISETDLKNLKLKQELGLATEKEVASKENEIEQSKISIAQAEIDLKKAKEGLNKTMGIAQNLDIIVEYEPVIENKTFDVENVVVKARTLSANVVSAESNVKVAEYDTVLDTNESIFESVNRQAERDLADAKRALEDAKTEAENNARTAYNNFERHRLADESLRIARDEAITTYNNLVINYQTGYITKNDLNKAKVGITKAEFDIIQNSLQYNIYLFQLEHPELF